MMEDNMNESKPEDSKPNIPIDSLHEFDDELEKLNKSLDNIPAPPEEFKDKKTTDKIKKEIRKKAISEYATSAARNLAGLKSQFQESKKEFEKDFVFKKSLSDMIFFWRSKIQVKVITPYGNVKTFKKTIKGNTIKVLKGEYQIQLKAIVKEKGMPTIYYHQNNPMPIIFDSEKFPYLINAESIKQMFNANIVSQIFAGLSMGKMIGWTAGIILSIGAAIALVMLFAPGLLTEVTPDIIIPYSLINYLWGKNAK